MSHDVLRISGHLDIASKSLKIWIQYPNLYQKIKKSKNLSSKSISKSKDFHPVFHWVSKHTHMMWYICSDLTVVTTL